MSHFIKRTVTASTVVLFLTLASYAQEKPKVGLVLSGGGAKGMAHIGALELIEEAGITIDYIGGTSMGAIIGGLYAAGYPAKQLDSIFRNTNLAELIQDNVPRGSKSFYDKDNSERYALTLPFDGFKVRFPAGISTGQDIYNQLSQLLYHVKDVGDFNQLPTPFLCIATNIETGDPIVLDSGYLPEAILASGTLPSLFEPVHIGNNVLIDGGVVNNYPIDEVRNLGADIIIGVDVQHGLASREDLGSATDILLQVSNYQMVDDMVEKSKKTDIYIKPAIEPYSLINFEKTDEIIKTGRVAAKKVYAQLEELAQRQNLNHAPKEKLTIPDSLTINRMILKGNERYTRGYIKGKLRLKMGEKSSFEKLSQGMNNLAATDNFNAIRYQLATDASTTDMTLNLNEKPNKLYLKAGAHYDDLFKSAALMNLTRKNFLFDDDVAALDLIVGDHLRYTFQYYLDKGTYWSFGIGSTFADLDEEVLVSLINANFDLEDVGNLNELTLDLSDLTNQIYLQTVVKEEFALRLGIEHKLLRLSTTTLSNVLDMENSRTFFENSNYFSTFSRLRLDTYDDAYFPSSGLFFDGDFHAYWFSSDFNNNFSEFAIGKARMGTAFRFTPKLSINIETEGGFKLGTSNIASFDFLLGGFGNAPINNVIPFFGYDYLSLAGNSFVKAFAKVDYEFTPKSHLLLVANMANVEDDIFRTGEWFTLPDYSGFGIGLGFETILGPMKIIRSWSPETNEPITSISLGYWF